ncbi:MAG: hypothetical protein WC477_07590 [Patescibacteria group bacterium]
MPIQFIKAGPKEKSAPLVPAEERKPLPLVAKSTPSPKAIASSLIDFFSRPKVVEVEEVRFDRDGTRDGSSMHLEARPIPLLEDWCIENRITTTLLKTLAERFEEVAEAIQFARDVMKSYLVERGLTKQYDSHFAIFVAANETGMKVKSEVVHRSAKPGRDVLDEIEAEEESIIDAEYVESEK